MKMKSVHWQLGGFLLLLFFAVSVSGTYLEEHQFCPHCAALVFNSGLDDASLASFTLGRATGVYGELTDGSPIQKPDGASGRPVRTVGQGFGKNGAFPYQPS